MAMEFRPLRFASVGVTEVVGSFRRSEMSIASAQVVRQTGWTPLPLFAYKHAARWQVSVLRSHWFYWPTIRLKKRAL